MPKLSAVCVAVLVLLGAPAVHAQEAAKSAQAAPSLEARLDALVGASYKPNEPGATVIVVKDGKTLLRKAYGIADTKGMKPMEAGMVLRLGSITKQFTAVGILMLAEEGKLALTDDITRFFPDYPAKGRKITVEHLLTHTSGIASYTSRTDYPLTMGRDVTPAQMIDSFKNDPLDFEPGTAYRYNNSGYFLLGAIIEKVSGMPYAKFVEQRIFVPLVMKDTAYEGYERSKTAHAAGHTQGAQGYEHSTPLSMSQPYAAGSLVSSVDDLARWDAAVSQGKLLKPASWKRVFTPYTLADGKSTGYGYGWQVGSLQGVPVVSHGGGINGFSTYALRLPEQKVFVAVLSNADGGVANPGVVASKAAALAMGKPFREFREIALDAATLDRYVGVYEVEKGITRSFRREGEVLVMQRSGRSPMRLKAFSPNGFYLPDGYDWFEFVLDDKGRAASVNQYFDGKELKQPRIGDAPAVRTAVKIANEAYDKRVGRYQLAPGFILELSREGDRYYAQATGQGKLEIFAASDTVFFARAVDAEVRFDGSDSSQLVLHQNGQQIKAPRL
ncbi:serine hydrolase [Massilia sp. YIM B02769]|uniref:serine hydrolase n=1 Tax=Massilia sp. YIM B02769 TaxID=3050129 RepID=UPI0025B6ABBA|nr:serine hydrolase [Massilia sp. YIM B02769]MDN4056906.1 serine hydrolase [Massilia sp. YIM B02769]